MRGGKGEWEGAGRHVLAGKYRAVYSSEKFRGVGRERERG